MAREPAAVPVLEDLVAVRARIDARLALVVSARPWLAAGVFALALATAGDVRAGTGEGYSVELYHDLMSPYCPGRTLMDCPSAQAAELREWIAAQEEAGRSRAEVEEQLYQRYGDAILQAPKAQGFGVAAYAIPIAAVVVGGAIVATFLRRQGGGGGAPPPAPTGSLDPEVERRIDEELRA